MGKILVNCNGVTIMTEINKFNSAFSTLQLQGISENAAEKLCIYHKNLTEWNKYMNLTGNTDFDDAFVRHYWDSFAPLSLPVWDNVTNVIDVGTGAGFPGLVLAILKPNLQITLLDSLKKRLLFLEHVAKETGVSNVNFVHARAEDGGNNPMYRERFDIALARAVAPLSVLCELVLPFAKVKGKMLAYKGPLAIQEMEDAKNAIFTLGGAKPSYFHVPMPENSEYERFLVCIEKRRNTPRYYPRKAGTPSKNPL